MMPIWEEVFGPHYTECLEFYREANKSDPVVLAESTQLLQELNGMPLEEFAFRIVYADMTFTGGAVRFEAVAAAQANVEVMLRTWMKFNHEIEDV